MNLSAETLAPTDATQGRKRLRVLVAKPGLDGHDRGALVLCRAFRDAGMEVIYSGLLPTPDQVAQIAIDEDVDVVALSLLNGAHLTAFPKVVTALKKRGGSGIIVVGGGIIPEEDKRQLEKKGILGNFGPGTSLNTIVDFVRKQVLQKGKNRSGSFRAGQHLLAMPKEKKMARRAKALKKK